MNADEHLLAGGNPFADPVARIDAEVPPPDVAGIHADVREALHTAIAAVRETRRPALVLVKGDPGQGKTHQLAWLRHRADDGKYFFVEVPPLKDERAPFGHILRYMVQGLAVHRSRGSTTTSLERLVWECLRRVATAVVERARDEGDAETVARIEDVLLGDKPYYIDAFADQAVGDPGLGDVLFGKGRRQAPLAGFLGELGQVLCRMTDRGAQAAALDWLRGVEIGDEDLALLRVKRPVDTEDRSFEVLRALVSLAARPIALCFDQLESTQGLLGTAGVVTLANALMEIYQQMPVCLILMCQNQFWAETSKDVPLAVRDRLRELPVLAKATPAQATELVASRLAPGWLAAGVTPPYPSYPFSPDFIRDLVDRERPTLRRILAQCGERLEAMRRAGAIHELTTNAPAAALAPAVADARAAIGKAFQERLREIPRGPLRDASAREEFVRAGLLHIMGAHAQRRRPLAGMTVSAVDDPPRARAGARSPAVISLAHGGVTRRIAIDVHSSDSRGAWRVAERLCDVIGQGKADAAVLLREAEAPLPAGAGKTQERVAELALTGGGLFYVETEQAHRLVAAELLLDAASAADVSIGEGQASRDEALGYLLDQDVASELAGMLGRVATGSSLPVATPTPLEADILRVLTSEKKLMTVVALSAALGVPPEEMQGALDGLVAAGEIQLSADRKRLKLATQKGR